jgi:hypothetical protein
MAGHRTTLDRVHEETLARIEGEPLTLQLARSVKQVVSALVEDPPSRAAILIADFDAIAPGDVMELHTIRERGWFGAGIATETTKMPKLDG